MASLPQRPFQIIVLSVFALAAIAGLFLFANFSGFLGGNKSIGNVVIWGTLSDTAINNDLAALKANHKEYSGVTYVQKPAATFNADLADAIAAGTGPDAVIIDQEDLLANENKLQVVPFSTLPQRTYLDTFVPEAQLFLTDKGTFGVPLVIDPLVLFYNRPILASAGVATPPSTWEAVTGMAGKLTQKNGGVVSQSAIDLGTYDNVPDARAVLSLLFLQAGLTVTDVSASGVRSTLAQASTQTFGQLPGQAALGFYTQFADPAKAVFSWANAFPKADQAFLAGNLAFYPGFASEAAYLAQANPNLDFDMAPIPQPGTATSRVTYGRVYAFAIPKASHNAAGAYQAAVAIDGGAADIARALSMAPAQRALLKPSASDRFEPVFYPEALTAKGWLSPAPAVTDRIFAAMIQNVNTGLMEAAQAISTADQALNAAL